MRAIAKVSCLLVIASVTVHAQLATWTSNSGGKEQYTGTYNNYDYELWNQEKIGSATMKVTGDNGQGANAKGGTFEAEWSGTCNVLFRSGKKWGSNSTQNHTQIGNITFDFEATWNSPDDVKYLSVYGWAYFTQANKPNNFSNEIEYYIVQDRGSYNPCNNQQGSTATIDGIEYGFHVCDRMGQPALSGNNVNFKQFFSIPKDPSKHRRSGKISVSEHFKAWHSRGMYMDGPMYEVAMKVESYKCSNKNGSGSGTAKVTKNILTIGGSSTTSSSSTGTTTPSSSSLGASSSSRTQATTCKTPLITYPTSTVPSDPYTACFKYTNNKCYVCKVANEGDGNTCASAWVWSGNQIATNLENGYWYQEVTCPAGSSSSVASSSSRSSSSVASSSSRSSSSVAASSSSRSSSSIASSSSRSSSSVTDGSSSSTANDPNETSSSSEADDPISPSSSSSKDVDPPSSSSDSGNSPIKLLSSAPNAAFNVRAMNNGALLVESNAHAAIYLYDTKGNLAQKIQVSTGASVVQTSVPAGLYVAKNASSKQTQMVVVK